MKTKLLTIKSLLVAAGLCLGQSAWGDDYSAVYTKTLSGETAWASSDLTAWGVAENTKFSVSETTGLTLSVKGENHSASYTVSSIATTSKIKYVVEWNVGSVVANNVNNTTNNTYLMFGDKLRLSFDRGYHVFWSVDGTFINDADHQVSSNSTKDKTVTVTLIYDPILRTVESFTTSGINSYANDLTSNVRSAFAGENIDMRKVTLGYYCTGNYNDVTTSIKSIVASECTQVVSGNRYTINAVDGSGNVIKGLKSAYASSGETVSVSNLSLVVEKNGKFYEMNDGGVSSYGKSFTMGDEEATFSVIYKEASDIVYFKEAESFAGSNSSTANAGASGGAYTAYFRNNTTNDVTTLDKGLYRIETYIWDRANQHINLYNTTKDDANILAQLTGSGSQAKTFVVGTDNTATVLGCTANSCCFDYLIIRKVYDVTEIVGATDYTTNYSNAWNTTPVWINAGETGYYKFANFNNTASANLFENWYLFGATEASENIVIFGPNHSNTATKSVYNSKPTFTMADLNGATVELYTTLTAAADGTYTLVTTAITTKADGTKLNPNLVYTQTGLPVAKLKLYISPEKNYLGLIESASNVAIPANFAVTGTIASSGYSSLASGYGLDFSSATGIETAYVVTNITKDAVTLTSVDELPANSGVILKGTAGATYSIPVKADAAYDGTNKLKAAVTATAIAANDAYILKGGKFCQVTGASTVPAGKAYLLASDIPAFAPELGFIFDGGTTGINSVVARDIQNGEFYNLNGQRVSAPTKCLYIVNGKKVIVK